MLAAALIANTASAEQTKEADRPSVVLFETGGGWTHGELRRPVVNDLPLGSFGVTVAVSWQLPIVVGGVFRTITLGPRLASTALVYNTHNVFTDADLAAVFRLPLTSHASLRTTAASGPSYNTGEWGPEEFAIRHESEFGFGWHGLLGLGLDHEGESGGWGGELRIQLHDLFVHRSTTTDTRTGETAVLRQEVDMFSVMGTLQGWFDL